MLAFSHPAFNVMVRGSRLKFLILDPRITLAGITLAVLFIQPFCFSN
jgi:hypothetical protein